MTIKFEEEKQKKELESLRRTEEEESVKLVSSKYGVPYIDLASIPINTDALKIISEDESRSAYMAIIQKVGKKLQIAVKNPEKPETKAVIKRLADESYSVSLFLVSKRGLEKAWSFYQEIAPPQRALGGSIDVSSSLLEEFSKEAKTIDEIKERIEKLSTKATTEVFEMIIAGAVSLDASDVHLEAQEKSTRLRYRLDGVLQDITEIKNDIYKLIISRIKLVSELKLNIHDRPQDGRFTIKLGGTDVEVRVSTLPGPYGENTVLRILNPKTIGIKFEELGMQPWIVEIMSRELEKPNGMILTTGPTGSGKTPTLYAFLKKVHKPGVKIITLEDPIEYHLAGIEQTQVFAKKGYDFASGLRAILRQDPDVILVGEIRDLETAETAIHASLTGHLVFSTLHTNNAAGTIPRLVDIGVKPGLMAPGINVAMGQRLVRKLCEKCKKEKTATKDELNEIESKIKTLPQSIKKPDIKNLKIYAATGCDGCHKTGYKGRIGVYEIILIDEKLEKLIMKKEGPTETDMKEAAFSQGQINMKQDAILKIIAGITDIEEMRRVLG